MLEDKKKLDSIYIHVPFCGSTCDFCAFYQEKPRRVDLERYLEGIRREFELKLPKGEVETVFMGGGTPGLLPAKDLEFIGGELLKYLGKVPKEWTVEMAPATVKLDKLLVMKEMGVTRISMGVQSFNEERLKGLGRMHSPKQVYKAYERVREVGFDNVNLDMMFALPGQNMGSWEEDLKEVIRLGPEHISTYCLTFEEDTALYIRLSQGKVSIDEEKEREMYLRTWEVLEGHGYGQYEVSNFAKAGRECLHNINTWEMGNWLGFGPSASSQYGGKRFTNVSHLGEWLEGVESGNQRYVDEVVLTDSLLAEDRLIFGLRMNRGVNIRIWEEQYGVDWEWYEEAFDGLIQEGLCEWEGDYLRVTREGRLLVDSIGEMVYKFKS